MVSFVNIIGGKGLTLLMALGIGLLYGSTPSVPPSLFQGQTASEEKEADVSTLSASEIRSKINSLVSSWPAKKAQVAKMLSAAQAKKNIMRINCVGPKLKGVEFWVKEGKQTQGETASSNAERLRLLYQKVAVINNNIEGLVVKASRCIGDEKFSLGEGLVLQASHPDEFVFDPDVPVISQDPFLEVPGGDTVFNPDWSVDLTFNAATPYY